MSSTASRVQSMNSQRIINKKAALQRATDLLEHLYAPEQARITAQQLIERIVPHTSENAEKNEALLITYANSISGEDKLPVYALNDFLQEFVGDAFGAVHLLPFFPSSSDDGFAVIDYRRVDHHTGTWDGVSALSNDYNLMFDLVINHCSRENLWFADFVSGQDPGKDYFITLPEESDTQSVTRPRSSPLISSVPTYSGIRHVWTTFSSDQIDLDFSNPDVLVEFVDILLFYIARGATLIRLDAVAFLWKRLGTSCMSLPETHCVVKLLRTLMEWQGGGVRLITETNVPHEENLSYFGVGDEAHAVYQFSLAPLLLYSYTFRNSNYLQQWASSLAALPSGCTVLNFLASHDGIGMRPLEGLLSDTQVDQLVEKMHQRGGFASMRDAGNGVQRPYEINIALFSAFGGTPEDIPAYIGAHLLLMSFQGMPTFYIHSLLASKNDLANVEQTGRTRSINRGHLSLENLREDLSKEESPRTIVLTTLLDALQKRHAQPALLANGSQRVIETNSQAFAMWREATDQTLLVIASITADSVELDPTELGLIVGTYTDRYSGNTIDIQTAVTLAPWQVLWLDTTKNNQ